MAGEQLLFKREVRVLIAAPIANDFASISTSNIEIEDLRVQFKVEKNSGKEPNTAEVVITNLSGERRAQVQRQGGKFILHAGYITGMNQLFVGDIRTVDHVREGPNWNTKITSGDGERAFRFARVNESFKGGTPVGDVLSKIASSMGVGLGNTPDVVASLSGQYVHGFSAFGPSSRELTRVLSPLGLSWSIQDGALQLLRDDQNSNVLIPDITPSTGLVGSPEFGAAEKNKGPVIKLKCLLQGRILPGGRVRISSERYKGELRVTKVVHAGDTAGAEWYTNLEGEPLGTS